MRHSRSEKSNPAVKDWTKDYTNKTNLEFFADALKALEKEKLGNGGRMVIGLLGSRDLPGVTLRQAQSVLRWDLRPSLWSHAFVIVGKANTTAAQIGRTRTLGVSLHPRTSEFPKPERNGVSEGTLKLFEDPKLDANAALLAVNLTDEDLARIEARAAEPNLDRQRYDLWETLGVWQGYLWSFGTRPNPLREGYPIPASSFVEYCYEAINLDLTPGASERNSAPEHIWNAAKWWREAYATQDRHISGYSVLRDKGCSLLSAEEVN